MCIRDRTGPYVQLTAGNDHNCGLKADGSVDCWGRNDYGQATDQPGPFVALAAGGHFTCALRADGGVDCWGINPDGRADDQAGPFGPTALDAFAPDTLIDSGPDNPTEATGATFTFRGNEYGATFACSLDGGAYAACANSQSYSGLAAVSYTHLDVYKRQVSTRVEGACDSPTPRLQPGAGRTNTHYNR